MSEGGEKRFDATPHRKEQARQEGRFARARDASGLAATAAVLGVLLGSRSAIGEAAVNLFGSTLGDVTALARGESTVGIAGRALAAFAAPAAVGAALAALGAGIAQAGFNVNLSAVGLKLERLDPIARLKQLASPKRALTELVLSLLRVAVVGFVAYRVLMADLSELLSLARVPVEVSGDRIVAAILHVVLGAGAVLLAIAILDYVQSRIALQQELKMSRQELMEEMRQQDGDPRVKGRMKARARALAKKRALQNVKKAKVIVTNPTHVAVALRYEETDAAPVVVAKGHDDDALRIRAEARKYGIPILENRPLARALDAEVQIGQAIPMAHFAAVARVLAFVYRLRAGRGRGTARA
jgi:flagellar biosynthetic protein FlhB